MLLSYIEHSSCCWISKSCRYLEGAVLVGLSKESQLLVGVFLCCLCYLCLVEDEGPLSAGAVTLGFSGRSY